MSERWPGGIVRSTPVTPTGPLQNGAAPGIWSLAEASYWTKQGLWPTAGNFLAVEDVFSTYLYTGTGAAQTITNGIDLAGKGGLVIQKERSSAYNDGWFWADTVRGANNILKSQNANGQITSANTISAFSSTGFTAGSNISFSGSTYASWTFREAPKFFDVVTYTGNGTTQSISHNLGVAPGVIIVKQTDTTRDWVVYHRSLGETYRIFLNATNAATNTIPQNVWGNNTSAVAPTSTNFTVGDAGVVNASGGTYVAYLFAHDTTSDGIIQCGSYTGNGSATGPSVTLGWEPQWLLVKNATTAVREWFLMDNMRGFTANGTDAILNPNNANAESSQTKVGPTATGFQPLSASGDVNASGDTYIYIAIRRGPMRTPTTGTSVFSPQVWTGNATSPRTITGGGFPVDLSITYNRGAAGWDHGFVDRLRGAPKNTSTSYFMYSNGTTPEITNQYGAVGALDIQDGVGLYTGSSTFDNANASGNTYVGHLFRRAPSFFDEVCYTGTGSATTFNHNLGVAPELMIVKPRGSSGSWRVYAAPLTATKYLTLNQTAAAGDDSTFGYAWNKTAPTSTVFSLGTGDTNSSGVTHVNYLFASCPGVSKVGSYTGTGTTQTINCGFTTGARFVLIKRTDSTGDWYVWDSARGIVAGNDPYLLLNSTAAEVTSTDYIDTDNSGFQISSTAPAGINANGGTFIYLAIS